MRGGGEVAGEGGGKRGGGEVAGKGGRDEEGR